MTMTKSLYQSGGISADKLKLPTTLRPVPLAQFVDRAGENRTIQVGHNRRLRVKNIEDSIGRVLSCSAGKLIGANIRKERVAQNMTAQHLGDALGMLNGKNQIVKIEKADRLNGIHFGTLFAVCLALDVPLSKIIPSEKEVLANVAFVLDWKEQRLGKTRFGIVNKMRAKHGLQPLDKSYLYNPAMSNDTNVGSDAI